MKVFISYIHRAIEEELMKRFYKSKSVAITDSRQVDKAKMTKTLFPQIKERFGLNICYLYH